MPTDPKHLRGQADRLRLLADEQESGYLADLMREVARGVAELVPAPPAGHRMETHSVFLAHGEASDGGAVLTWRSDLVTDAEALRTVLAEVTAAWAVADDSVRELQESQGYHWNVGDVFQNAHGSPSFDALLAEHGVELVSLEGLQPSRHWGHDDTILPLRGAR